MAAEIKPGEPMATMTLRDYFAAQALMGRMVNGIPTTYMVGECYQAADLMLEARDECRADQKGK